MKTLLSIISLVLLLGIAGCSDDSSSSMPEDTQQQFTITPNDGATNIRLDASITLSFAQPVDRAVVQQNFHLISELAMADSLCPVSDSMNHGMMNTAMMDSMKMNHVANQHSTPGTFIWNTESTKCTFQPDSMMMSNMQYMLHMGQEMMQMMNSRMGTMGMMSGHGTGTMSETMMYHFRTMDTSQAGGGHESHHP
ncbi:MAG: hypothetical protein EPO24_04770 [Bacteroidetes bacterium]|nr:MAG: hypothetical protein EPO24_04770 [Bacteroidota bacterium]